MIIKCLQCDKIIKSGWTTEKYRSDAKYCSKKCWSKDFRKTKEGWAKSLLARAKTRSRNKKIDFDLDENFILYLLDEQNNKCAISGVDISFDSDYSGRIDQYRGSIDRVDSSLGYTKDNVQIVCAQINIMKHQSTNEELYFWASKIVEGLS